MEHILVQPNDSRFQDAKNVMTLKEMMIFITPAQPEGVIEKIVINKWRIKVVGFRPSDQFESRTAFPFQYVPHDYYEPCIHCNMDTDGYSGQVSLPTPIEPARPGVRKRNMTESNLSAKKPKSNQTKDDHPEVEVLLSESPSPSSSPLLMSPNQPPPQQEPPSLLQSYLLERLKAPLASASISPPLSKTEQKCLISGPPLTPGKAPRSPIIATLGPSHSLPVTPVPSHSLPSHSLPSHSLPSHSLPSHSLPSHSLPVTPVPGPASLYTSSQTQGPGKVSVIRSILNSRSKADSPPQQSNKKLIALLTAPLASQKKVLSKDPCQNEKEAKKTSYTSPQANLHSLSLSPSQTSRPLPELIPINVFGQPQTDNKDR